MTEEEELKARIEAAKRDLGFFSLYSDQVLEEGFATEEELEESINETLDDLIDARNKLNER